MMAIFKVREMTAKERGAMEVDEILNRKSN